MKLNAIVGIIVFGLPVSSAWKVTANNPIFFGDPFRNLTTAELNKFTAGKDEFMAEEGVTDGLGPVFNGKSCAECHSGPAAGGDSEITETRFGTITNGHFNSLTQFGGSLIQSRGIGGEPGAAYNIAGETVPPQATEVALRRTTPLWGLHARKTFLHDGRANTVADAISTHDGQGAKASQKFNALSAREVIELLAFLNSL